MRAFIVVACLALVSGCDSSTAPGPGPGDPVDAAADAVPSADARPPGASCGGFAGNTCGTDSYCDFPGHTCGQGDMTGTCVAKPPGACPGDYKPVCGCNGDVFSNECAASAAGVDTSVDMPCAAPQGTTKCGYRFCESSQCCQKTGDGAAAEYACKASGTCT